VQGQPHQNKGFLIILLGNRILKISKKLLRISLLKDWDKKSILENHQNFKRIKTIDNNFLRKISDLIKDLVIIINLELVLGSQLLILEVWVSTLIDF
jgi:hypothetical protein